jgi:hypothetical protein
MKTSYNIGIIVLLAAVVFAGYFLFKKPAPENQVPESSALEESTVSLDESEGLPSSQSAEELEEVSEKQKKEFAIFVDENTKIFRIDPDNPYTDEAPATITVGPESIPSADLSTPYEISGEVFDIIYQQEKTIRIYSDYPKDIEAEFIPRGLEISLEDIKIGDRIVASGKYKTGKDAGIDFRNMEFIQVLLPLETAPEGQ